MQHRKEEMMDRNRHAGRYMPGSELRSPDKHSVDMRHFEFGGWPLSR